MNKERWAYIKELGVGPGTYFYGKADPYTTTRRRMRRSGKVTARQQRKRTKLARQLRHKIDLEGAPFWQALQNRSVRLELKAGVEVQSP